jgi:arylsulfatase A-like enzyme
VSRLSPLVYCLGLFAFAACAPQRPLPPKGVLVLLVDALRADTVGLYGSRLPATPALDALAPESVVFEHAFAQASWTRPSVPSLLTGLYPSEHGLVDFESRGPKVAANVLSPQVVTLAEGMKAAGYRTAMVGYQAQLSLRFGFGQGFDFYNNNTMGAERIDRRFLGWLDEEPERPFFAYLHYLDIHWPYCPPSETFGKFNSDPDAIRLCDNWHKLREDIREGVVRLTDSDRAVLAARYAEEMLALDSQIGRLFQGLRKRGVWDDTLIVVTADHGEELNERGGIEHGHTLYDELLHVPFVWKLPAAWQKSRGRRVGELIETRSLLPTLFDLVRQPVAKEVTAPSLLPWVLGRPPRKPPYEFVAAESNGIYAVRTDKWKLVFTPEKKSFELYDLAADPGERVNVAGQRPEELAQLQRRLSSWRKGLHALTGERTALDDKLTEELKNLGYL